GPSASPIFPDQKALLRSQPIPWTPLNEGPRLATFATEGAAGEFCVDVETQAVVVLNRSGDIFPVNSSIDRFNDCVQAIVEAWPDWQLVSYPDECERITDEIKARIASIDERALEYEIEGYWVTICDDLGMGNYI
ncbi:SUKH-4 family immunity protein, partial [Actinoplanes xinjiangensis]|uniref:SUKH-4 family immunity protein n=1 Tax=Actinoplanes xinjiangensis TaxID=512350 RepID=UPI00344639CD